MGTAVAHVGRLRPARILALAAALGIAGGIGLSLWKQQQHRAEIDRIATAPDRLDPRRFPEPPPQVVSAPRLNPLAVDGIPHYPGASASDLLSQRPGQGSEMQIAWFETRDELEAVISFYEAEFSKMQVPWVTHRYSKHAAYVGFLEADRRRLHLVSLLRQKDRTLVLPSTSYPAKLLAQADAQVPDLPRHPATVHSLVFHMDESAMNRRTVVATLGQQTVEGAVAWYQQALSQAGWKVEQARVQPSGEGGLEARSGRTTATVTVRKDTRTPKDVVVYVTLSD